MKILIAEDADFSRLLIEQQILSLGYDFVSVSNGQEVIDKLQEEDFDLLLLDIEMPIKTGVEAMEFIRTQFQEPKKSIPAIAFTAHESRTYIDGLIQKGFTDSVRKPADKLMLKHCIEKALAKS